MNSITDHKTHIEWLNERLKDLKKKGKLEKAERVKELIEIHLFEIEDIKKANRNINYEKMRFAI